MVLECGDSFGMGIDAMFASATEHVIDIFLDIIVKVAASEAVSINTVGNFCEMVESRSPFMGKLH